MGTRTRATDSDTEPGRVRIVLAVVWMVLSLALGGLVTAEGRQATGTQALAEESLP